MTGSEEVRELLFEYRGKHGNGYITVRHKNEILRIIEKCEKENESLKQRLDQARYRIECLEKALTP